MYPRRSSRQPKASKRRGPSPDKEVIQSRVRDRKTGRRKTKEVNGVDKVKGRDIIDIIDSSLDASGRVDKSDLDCESVAGSAASSPSFLRSASPKKPRPSRGLCSACKTQYQKAKKMKEPIKNKLLDNDPKSLTCDQWVLIKRWRPRRPPNARGMLLIHVQLVKKRLTVKNGAKQPAQYVEEEDSSACSRPHAFLQRNLRQHVSVPVKKSRRKRTRGGSQGPRVAKQQRLHGNSIDSAGGHNNSSISSPGSEGRSDREVNDQADTNLTAELIHSTVTTETTKPREVPPMQETASRRGGFRDLLAQLRGNSSRIVRETR